MSIDCQCLACHHSDYGNGQILAWACSVWASVNLSHARISVKTAVNGTFTITGTTGIACGPAANPEHTASFFARGNHFYFSTVAPGEKVTLKLFDLQGFLQRTVSQTFASAGRHEIIISQDKLAHGVRFINFSSKDQSGFLCSVKSGVDLLCANSSNLRAAQAATENPMAKAQAVYVDTLKVIKSGYLTAVVPISGYQLNAGTITLQLPDTCVPKRAASGDGHGAGTIAWQQDVMYRGTADPGTSNPNAPIVTAVGTVYSSITGGTPDSGATITLVDSMGNVDQSNYFSNRFILDRPDLHDRFLRDGCASNGLEMGQRDNVSNICGNVRYGLGSLLRLPYEHQSDPSALINTGQLPLRGDETASHTAFPASRSGYPVEKMIMCMETRPTITPELLLYCTEQSAF